MSSQYAALSHDDPELDITLQSLPIESLRVCDACGKLFLPTGRNAWRMRFCQRTHYIECKICGNTLNIIPNKCIPSTCSKSCANVYKTNQARLTMISRYGVSNPSQVAEFKEKARISNAKHQDATMEKIRATMIARYGAAIPRQVPELKKKIDDTMLERYGVVNPSHSKIIRDKISQSNKSEESKQKYKTTSMMHYGTDYPAQNPDAPNGWNNVKDKCESTMLAKYGVTTSFRSPECQEKAKQTCMQRYGCENPSQSPEIHRRKWNTRKELKGCDGTPLDSTWEQLVYNYWISLGLTVERNIPIKFEYKGKQHTTFIDFRVGDILFEVKGKPYLEGVYDYKQPVPIEKKLEVYRTNHVVLITDDQMRSLFGHKNSTESNGLKHLDICPNPLIGVDLSLFLDTPEFPFAPNRPKCFYYVSVNGCPSQYDAFYDKKLRWNIIQNRIQYVGGFIDSKEVLVGFNVTRKAKQPSWFSEKYAVKLISKYCTSDIIVDPFAGWGTRYTAAQKLHKTYLGIDLNPELVEWHKSLGRHIELGDATSFAYSGNCSVFTCPPYKDTEVYFEGQNSEISQCQWLSIIMQNIPNASEYVMVCKVVDPGWEKYIVETKQNKSHFGVNVEYVILVPNPNRS